MVSTLVTTPPIQPARGGGLAGRSCPREGVHTRCYAFLGRIEVVASNVVITGIVPFVGDSIEVDHVCLSCLFTSRGCETRVDLLLFSMVDFDVILGMYWLFPYHAIPIFSRQDCDIGYARFLRLEWRGTLDYFPSRAEFFLKAHRMMEKGCFPYLDFVRDVSANTPSIESVLTLEDFPDVFPANLPGMPPDWDIDFGIDMVSGTQPISIPPYIMAPMELKELKE
ncbi:uncharacterized protein [Nicotiana sylvestris]|uniref:uncharacterized protein n=1 Tax=Nicotiana sylvestris TaxID=4096 RepID=UPI00388CBCDF